MERLVVLVGHVQGEHNDLGRHGGHLVGEAVGVDPVHGSGERVPNGKRKLINLSTHRLQKEKYSH